MHARRHVESCARFQLGFKDQRNQTAVVSRPSSVETLQFAICD